MSQLTSLIRLRVKENRPTTKDAKAHEGTPEVTSEGTEDQKIKGKSLHCEAQGLLSAKQQHWHADAVLNAAGGSPQKQVSEETVAVSAHRHQVAASIFDPTHNF